MRNLTIVVGADGSADSRGAAVWAAEEAVRRGWSVTLLFADPPVKVRGLAGSTRLPPIEDVGRAGRQFVVDEAEWLRSQAPGVPITAEFVAEAAVPALIEASRSCRMIAVGSRGRSQVTALILGSVASHVCAHAECPVVVVRGEIRTAGPVVVGVDGSSAAEPALDVAFTEASTRGAPLDALHAYDLVPAPYEGLLRPPAVLGQDAVEAAALVSEVLAGWQQKYPDVVVRHRLVRGHPVTALLDASDSAQLVVLGSRGRGEFVGLVLGSTSAALIRGSGCPVAIARVIT